LSILIASRLSILVSLRLLSRPLQRLLDLVLNLLPQRLQRFVDFALDLFTRQLERLLHLLAHGLGDLALHLAEDRLDGLADLLLQCLSQVLVFIGRCSPIAVLVGRALAALRSLALVGRALAALRSLALPCAAILTPGIGRLVAIAPLITTLAIVGPRLTLSCLPSRLILIVRLPRPPCLFDRHHASLLSRRCSI